VMIEFSDQSTLKLTEQSLSSSSAEYEFNYSLANVYPQSVKMSHPQADSAIEQTLTPTADSETLFLTLVDNSPAAVTAEGDSSASGAAGGALSWLLLGIISILIRRSEVRPAARTLVRAGARHCG
ncbi:MAG: hypothetical protein P1U57_01340, partial [Oleibacter sp.]|nr:hypothetical protein [Thalassolituus sp.]